MNIMRFRRGNSTVMRKKLIPLYPLVEA